MCVVVLLLINSVKVKGQNEPLYTQYINNQLTFNPAYAGSNELLCAQLTSRNQWVGFNGRPVTNAFTIHSPIISKQMGGGLSIVNDQLGPIYQNSIYVDYAYKLKVNEKGYLSLGLKAGVDISQFNKSDMGDFINDDPSFNEAAENSFSLNFGLGAYYVSPSFYVGVGVPRLVKNSFNSPEQVQFEATALHYYLSAGAILDINKELKYRPSFQSRVVMNAPVLMELMNWGIYKNTYWLGVGYRLNDSVNLGLQVQASQQIRVGYTYDYALSDFGKYSQGTHEVSISFDFSFRKKHVYSPRYF